MKLGKRGNSAPRSRGLDDLAGVQLGARERDGATTVALAQPRTGCVEHVLSTSRGPAVLGMLRPPNLASEPAAAPCDAHADELYEAFKTEVANSPRRSLPVFAKLASEDTFTGRAKFGLAVERDEPVHHLSQITRRSAGVRLGRDVRTERNIHTLENSNPHKAARMQNATLSRLAQPKWRQPLQSYGSPARVRASPRATAAAVAHQVILKETKDEVEVEVDGKVFLVDLESQLAFQILPEITSDEEVGTWDAQQQLIVFRRTTRSPARLQPKAEPGNGIVERLLQYQVEKDSRMEEKRRNEQQKRIAEELAECRPSPRLGTRGSSSGLGGQANAVSVAERCQAWAEQREAKLEAARQRQRKMDTQLRGEPEPEHGA